jgi:hypothetical protein
VRCLLFDLWHKQERAGRREVAEADIRKISSLRQLNFQQHLDGWARGIDLQPAHDTPLQACDPVAERPKSGPEEHVLFEAVSAPPAGNHLLLKRRQVELGRTPEHDIERFIGD